ncbi:hypothetical protein [Pseudohongiella acticola]|uniref:hypothetical protein n=1 Tax=Pseudohongiella acticola TaxID=1524254 RepID=UPI0030ED89B0
MNNSDSKTSTLASLMLLLARLDVSADGTVARKSDIKKIRKAARAASARLSGMVGAVSNIVFYAQDATAPDPSLVWITTSLGNTIESVAQFIELVETVKESGQWPTPEEGDGTTFLGCLISLPYAVSRYSPKSLDAASRNMKMVEFAENAATVHLDTELSNLKRFTKALYDAHGGGNVDDNIATAISFAAEWTALVEMLLEIMEDSSYELREALKAAA